MIQLRTLGTVYIADDAGNPLGGPATQRRLLALLSILSVAAEGGMSRDRVQFLLWPDGDLERTRHALTQAVYHARRSLACDDLFLPGSELRLNSACITSDIQLVERALGDGDWVHAADLYRGPWLDGFHVPGARELDAWVDERRREISERMSRAFDELARDREAVFDVAGVVTWRRRQAALDPIDGRTALRLVEALVAAGDRPGALAHANVYEAMLRADLDVAPDPTFQALMDRLRRELSTMERSQRSSRPRAAEQAATVPIERGGQPAAQLPGTPRRSLTRTGSWAGIILVTVVLGMTVWSRMRRLARAESVTVDKAIVVAPFRVTGVDPSLSFLRNGIVELLSTRIGDDSSTRAVDPGAIIRAWRAGGIDDAADPPRSDVVSIARRLGAANVLVGGIVGDPRRLVITGTLLAVPTGRVVATAAAEGPIDSLTTVLDALAGKLLLLKAGESDRLANAATPPLRAIQAYLGGQALYRSGHYGRAIASYELSLRRDSSFALAALHLALAADRVNAMEQHDRALAIAWENRAHLSKRDRALLTAFVGPRFPEPSSKAEEVAAWSAAVRASPDRAESWVEFGERLYRTGSSLGDSNHEARAIDALSRAAALDPANGVARPLLMLLEAKRGDTAGLRSGAPAVPGDSVGGLGLAVGWRVAIAVSDSTGIARYRALLPTGDNSNLRAIAMASQFDAVAVDDGDRAIRVRSRHARNALDRIDVLLARHSLALNQGRPATALEVTRQLEALQPGSGARFRLRVLDALYGGGDTAAARRAMDILLVSPGAAPHERSEQRAGRLADLCVIAQWRLAQQEADGVADIITQLRAAGVPRDPILIGANPHTCAELLEATRAVVTGSSDAVAKVARLDSLFLAGPAVSDAAAYVHIAIARLYDRLGQTPRALAAIRQRPYMAGWPRYLATARREEGRLSAALGDRAGARQAFVAYLAFRSDPEPNIRADVAAVRLTLDSLSRASER